MSPNKVLQVYYNLKNNIFVPIFTQMKFSPELKF